MYKQRFTGMAWAAVAVLLIVAASTAPFGSLTAGQSQSGGQNQSAEKTQTKVVVLGTGTPRPYPDRTDAFPTSNFFARFRRPITEKW
jgi:hypothetical protein